MSEQNKLPEDNEDLSAQTYRLRKTIKELLEGLEALLDKYHTDFDWSKYGKGAIQQLLNKHKP